MIVFVNESHSATSGFAWGQAKVKCGDVMSGVWNDVLCVKTLMFICFYMLNHLE